MTRYLLGLVRTRSGPELELQDIPRFVLVVSATRGTGLGLERKPY